MRPHRRSPRVCDNSNSASCNFACSLVKSNWALRTPDMFAAETDRHLELQADLPFLEIAARQRLISVGAGRREIARLAARGEQVVAQPAPAIEGVDVQLRQEEVLRGDEFQFAAFHAPLDPPQFHVSHQGFAGNFVPVERHLGRGRLVDGTNQAPVGRRQCPSGSAVSLPLRTSDAQRLLGGAAEEVVLLVGLGLGAGFAALGRLRCTAH